MILQQAEQAFTLRDVPVAFGLIVVLFLIGLILWGAVTAFLWIARAITRWLNADDPNCPWGHP